jgi:pimeloyl-ACP methyl ester carboxylesterase
MPYLTRAGVRLYYEDHGQGLPVLLSHGFGASTGMWRGQVEALQQSYRLILAVQRALQVAAPSAPGTRPA